jgi:hypothetical protein
MGLECSSCSSYSNFSLLDEYFIWRWDAYIPYDWEYGQWERIKLSPVQVKIYKVKCIDCGEEYRVYPSLVLPGTTLTQPALIFISFVYETSLLTWRDIPEKFCSERDKIAHSTLYKACHGLGKGILLQSERIQEGIRKLYATYAPYENTILSGTHNIKTLYQHTRERAEALYSILLPLSYCYHGKQHFKRAFYTHLRPLRLILSSLDPPVLKLYVKGA